MKIVRFIKFPFKGHFRFTLINRRRIGGRKDNEGINRGGGNNILNGLIRVVDFAQPLVHTGCPNKQRNWRKFVNRLWFPKVLFKDQHLRSSKICYKMAISIFVTLTYVDGDVCYLDNFEFIWWYQSLLKKPKLQTTFCKSQNSELFMLTIWSKCY